MRQNILMYCEHSAGPGMSWCQHLWFIGNSKFYRVWQQSDVQSKRVLLKYVEKPLTWRQMIADMLEEDEIGLGGDLRDYIEIRGISGFQNSLLKLAWCKYEGPGESQLPVILRLDDKVLERLDSKYGELCSDENLSIFDGLISFAEDQFVSLDRVVAEIIGACRTCDGDREQSVEMVMQGIAQHVPPGPTKARVVSIERSEELAELAKGPCPRDPNVVAILLEKWLHYDNKPLAEWRYKGIGSTSTAGFLNWLVSGVGPEGFRSLSAADSGVAEQFRHNFLTHVDERIEHLRNSRGGGAFGGAMRAGLINSWKRLAHRVLGEEIDPNPSVD